MLRKFRRGGRKREKVPQTHMLLFMAVPPHWQFKPLSTQAPLSAAQINCALYLCDQYCAQVAPHRRHGRRRRGAGRGARRRSGA